MAEEDTITFVNPADADNFTCSICLDVITECVTTSKCCNQGFCKACLLRVGFCPNRCDSGVRIEMGVNAM